MKKKWIIWKSRGEMILKMKSWLKKSKSHLSLSIYNIYIYIYLSLIHFICFVYWMYFLSLFNQILITLFFSLYSTRLFFTWRHLFIYIYHRNLTIWYQTLISFQNKPISFLFFFFSIAFDPKKIHLTTHLLTDKLHQFDLIWLE